jgi:serine/threonine-protein kinase RsbW
MGDVMQVTLTLDLPGDVASIPVARHIVRDAMSELGILPRVVDDVQVALSEACANAVQHSGSGEEIEVRFDLRDELATIEVADRGNGFEPAALDAPDILSPRGRGVPLIRALVDDLEVDSAPGRGTVVQMQKRLAYGETRLFTE